MPELPEVETIRRGVEPYLLGHRIATVRVREPRLRWPVPPDFAARIEGRRVATVERRAKYLILSLDSGDRILIHLGMSGRLKVLIEDTPPPGRHDHVDLELAHGGGARHLLRFHDPRRFGAMLLWRAGEAEHPLLAHLGPEPFSEAFSAEHLYALSRGRRAPLKSFLMDGRVVVGAGNIYAAEALFRAGLRPGRAAGGLRRVQYVRLVQTVREVLAEAIARGGTTLRDFAGAHGEAGYFQQDLYVYGRAALPCRNCSTAIRRVVIAQRSSFYCPDCQR